MDLVEFRAWCLVDYGGGKARATVEATMKRVAYMQRHGLDVDAFASGPLAALEQGRAFLAGVDGKHAQRNYRKALNWLAAWRASLDAAFRKPDGGPLVWWKLPKHPRTQAQRFTDDQVASLLEYTTAREFISKRRRALIWVCLATGLRRGEVADLAVADLDRATGTVAVRKPRKDGKKRVLPLPADAWSPKRPLQAYLSARASLGARVAGDALWVHQDGSRMTDHELGSVELREVGQALGFAVSFTRFRHWRGKTLARRDVPTHVIQEALGHATPNTTRIYIQELTPEEMADEFHRHGVPGFG